MPRNGKSALIHLFLFIVIAAAAAAADKSLPLSFADAKGNIVLPADFRTAWTHLGTWVVPTPAKPGPTLERTAPGGGFHEVYADPGSVKVFQKTGKWRDGAVIVQEVRSLEWDDLPTGHVMKEGDARMWFVMIRDAKGRFPANSHWGDGWGWALFKPADAKKNVSRDYRQDCLSCHDVAGKTELIFTQGYPGLK